LDRYLLPRFCHCGVRNSIPCTAFIVLYSIVEFRGPCNMPALGRVISLLIVGCVYPILAGIIDTTPARADEEREIRCLALTIYYEARGEPEAGQLAVGHVVMNRTRNANFPSSVCDVVQEGGERRNLCQFSWWCDGLSDRPKDRAALYRSLSIAEQIYLGCRADPTRGALWFHTTGVKPSWSKKFGRAQRIGDHLFYRGNSQDAQRINASADETTLDSARCGTREHHLTERMVAAR